MKERKLWLNQTKTLICKEKKIPDNIKREAEQFLNDVKEYLNGDYNVAGSQSCIGFKQLFRGFILKDWFGSNDEEKKYLEANKIASSYIKYVGKTE